MQVTDPLACDLVSLVDSQGGGGHPLTTFDGTSMFRLDQWVEGFGLDTTATLEQTPASLGLVAGSLVWGCWSRSAQGAVCWRLNGLTEGVGWAWTGSVATAWASQMVTVGSTNRGLMLGELLVWSSELTDTQRGALASYIENKWGYPGGNTPTTGAVSLSVFVPSASAPIETPSPPPNGDGSEQEEGSPFQPKSSPIRAWSVVHCDRPTARRPPPWAKPLPRGAESMAPRQLVPPWI